MNYKVVMLDFDGTIARTIPAILHASEKMLNMHGYEIDPVQVERSCRRSRALQLCSSYSIGLYLLIVRDKHRGCATWR